MSKHPSPDLFDTARPPSSPTYHSVKSMLENLDIVFKRLNREFPENATYQAYLPAIARARAANERAIIAARAGDTQGFDAARSEISLVLAAHTRPVARLEDWALAAV